ncbi:MAG: hypothetical protein A2431_02435 [Candidatus Zambryskibacteria bacterium RIFOXYC1_FULL_39_10]|uniref:PKD domain-containing protein n=1 Tax=Candidatus Zambryskibacteria bacterium RIFOXYC1_FULL_39_10 TaxID=1802779 RepID=A0A1G2UY51_9BACT|nr:MAG: hypothetical protein A2431_02435 [Candidatus Zambryskibacteria bacterium RIFOXYC1_FULL_39_10]OHB14828.1 MAG: hypothetical protein A2605_01810 [Candidatus Zambryskibacteria bacterium RIFOXYD1_FULL_39_35]
MKNNFQKFLFVIFLFLVFPAISFAQLIINEIAWMGTTESANAEWVELYNTTSENIDLSGWGLYEAGGDTLMISLSKNIIANGYFLIERVTPSVSDSVSGIDDVSGSFGGGGLINLPGGEFLVLKDVNGNIIQSLDFSSGWLAGDNTTKETMQWTGSNWISASPTPGTANNTTNNTSNSDNQNPSGEVLSANTESSTNTQSSGGSTVSRTSSSGTQLEVLAGSDRTTLPGSPIWFQATIKKNTIETNLDLNWSFGDGNVGVGPLTSHTYKYSGDYVVVLSAKAGDMFSVSRLKVKVGTPEVLVSDGGEYLEISNKSNAEINLFNWKIENGGKGFIFQPDTIVLPHSSIKLDKSLLSMKGLDNSMGTSLKNYLGQEVFYIAPIKEVDLEEVSKNFEIIKNEAFVIQEKANSLGFVLQPKSQQANVFSAVPSIEKEEPDSEDLLQPATSTGNIIYEAPKSESFVAKLTNFIKRVFSN